MVTVGDRAPEFSLPDQSGKMRKLGDFLGQTIILYFYPKDMTSGCTAEACSFRDNHKEFASSHIPVLGVSMDNTVSHQKFATQYKLPYPLLSDEGGRVCKAYGVYVKKQMYGKEYWGIKRTTFIIDKSGKIAKIFDKVDPDNHAREVLRHVAPAVSRDKVLDKILE